MNTNTIIHRFKKQTGINITKNKMIYLIVMLIISACSNVPNPSATETVAERPIVKDYKTGEKWTWKWKRSVEGDIQAEGEASQEVVIFKDGLGFSSGLDTVEIMSGLEKELDSTPFRDWPLKVGKKWKYEENWESNDGTKGNTSQDAEVISFEEVKVDAGNFMAYKIEYKGRLTNSRGFDGKMEDIWWYAPVIKKYIKHTNYDGHGRYVKELINYSNPK